MLDPDSAGKEAASKLKPLIEAQDFQVEVIELEEGTDPGDLTQDTVNMIKGYIDDQDSSNRQSTH
jgi:DNA primase